ncbi:GAF domain-containing protein [Arthrobacter sp. D3-16]
MDGVDDEVRRRLELAATIGMDPRKLLPGSSGKSQWSEFELDAYLHGGMAWRKLERGRGAGKGSEGQTAGRQQALSPVIHGGGPRQQHPADRRRPREQSLSALGAAGKFLLTPEQAEGERLKSLHETNLLDSGAEEAFDRIVTATRKYFDVGAASLSLIAEDAQYFKSVFGPLRDETPRQIALCTATVEQNSMLIINDTRTDARFASNPLVVGEPHIRFYAGYPLHGPRGWNIGTLCIIDQKPRAFPPSDQQVLRTLAAIAQSHIDART